MVQIFVDLIFDQQSVIENKTLSKITSYACDTIMFTLAMTALSASPLLIFAAMLSGVLNHVSPSSTFPLGRVTLIGRWGLAK